MHHVVGAFILTFPMLRILANRISCELCSQRYPNLLPVAGGGGATLTLLLLYRNCFLLCHQNPIPRAFGVWFSVGQLWRLPFEIGYAPILFLTVTNVSVTKASDILARLGHYFSYHG
jgi:hypothetical protein